MSEFVSIVTIISSDLVIRHICNSSAISLLQIGSDYQNSTLNKIFVRTVNNL